MFENIENSLFLLKQIADAQSGAFAIQSLNNQILLQNDTFLENAVIIDGEHYWRDKNNVRFLQTLLVDEGGHVCGYLLSLPTDSECVNQVDSYASLNNTEDQFSVLNGLMADMLTYQTLDPLLQRIAEYVVEVTEADNALVLMVDEPEEYLHVVASAGPTGLTHIGETREYGVGFAGLAWSTEQNQYLSNSDDNTATKGYWAAGSQLVAMPLMSNDTVIGVAVLVASAQYKNFFKSTEQIGHLANLAGIAIVNAKAREQNQLELSRMRALRKINSLLENFDTTAELVQSASNTLMHAMDISRVDYLAVGDDGVTAHSDTWIKKDGVISNGESISKATLTDGINGWVYQNMKPAYLPRYHDDERESVDVRKSRIAANIGSTFAVPITANNGVVGVVSISRELSKRDLNENETNLFFTICNQISSALLNRELSMALRHRAFHDSLTELPNRYCFERELESVFDEDIESISGAMMFLDLDGFKAVNDSLGHHYGDELLIEVAERFKACLHEGDMLARIGGDEFAILSRGDVSTSNAMSVANQLIESLASSFEISGICINVGVSIGLSFFPQDGNSSDTLISNADEAMYRAKANGKGQIVRFDQNMADESQWRVQIEAELREAIKSNQFELNYQPQVDTYTGEVSSVEALIRWQHPTLGFISPGEFIPIAEGAGLINAIGSWVLKEAVSQIADWQTGPLQNIRVCVNIAASQFLEAGFSEQILQITKERGVSPGLLELEVTESIVLDEIRVVVSALNRLRLAGVRIAVDDFGTGYSSLSYLQDLPLDVLKIDRAFINRLENEPTAESLANTIMYLAKGLNLETVAEGVETAVQFNKVRQLGCTTIQGYYFAKPCNAEELAETINLIEMQFNQEQQKLAS